MSIESRLARLEESSGIDGGCHCPRNTAVRYGDSDGDGPGKPSDEPVFCSVCGGRMTLILVEYVSDWRKEDS